MQQSSGRLRLLIENFFAYGLINVLNRIIPILLLPILTRLLTNTADYGRFDMFNTLVSFGSALAGLGIYDAMFREYFEKDDQIYKRSVTSNALYIVASSSLIIAGLLLIFPTPLARIFLGDTQYRVIIMVSSVGVVLSALRSIVAAPTRIQNKRTIYIVSGTLSSLLYYGLAIFLIIRGFAYLGLIAANLFSSLILLLFFVTLNRSHFSIRLGDKKIRKELYCIGLPLMPTFLIYWVFHSIDKIMITNMMGLDHVGIYSIGSRIASVSQFIYAAFAGGFAFFKFSTMKDSDQVAMNSKLFNYFALIVAVSFIVVTPIFPRLFHLLFTGDYINGHTVAPALFLSPLLLMLFQIIGSQFLVIKKSYLISVTLTLGALANIVFNYLLIPVMGIDGAALATLSGYLISLLIMVVLCLKHQLLITKGKNVLLLFIVGLSATVHGKTFDKLVWLEVSIATILVMLCLLVYLPELKVLTDRFLDK